MRLGVIGGYGFSILITWSIVKCLDGPSFFRSTDLTVTNTGSKLVIPNITVNG